MKIKKGDTVKILYGKDADRQGTVVAVDMKHDRVVVDGINVYKKHVKGDGRTRTSEILNIVKPLPISKVMLVCPNCNKPTRVGLKREKDTVERICKRCGKVVAVVEKKEEPKKESKKSTKKTTKKVTKKSNKKESK